jgi:hypothetical protein
MVNLSFDKSTLQDRKKIALESGKYLVDWVEDELRGHMEQLPARARARLPQERALAKSFDVSLNTVRSAMNRLKKERLVHSIQGKGTFLVPSGKKTGPILVVGNNPYHPYQIMAGGVISSVLREKGFPVDLYLGTNPEEELDYIRRQENIFGVILIGASNRNFLKRALRQTKAPVVCIGGVHDELVRTPVICNTVMQDYQPIAHTATEYLIRAGHQRIVLCRWGKPSASVWDTIRGYRTALEMHGIKFREEWVVAFPSVPFGHANDAELYHQPAEEIQRQVDRWFEPGVETPTALIHTAATELQIRDTNHYYFHDHFSPDVIVGMNQREYLNLNYNGMGKAVSVCHRFEKLVHRALELLQRPRDKHTPPIRETHEELYVYERTNGVWKRRDFNAAEDTKNDE